MAYVISISNGKGGVAKTTSCIALGSSLAEMGFKVLLIDLDPNANLTLGLGTFPDQPVGFSRDLFLSIGEHSIKCTKTGYKNLDIIPSNKKMAPLDEKSLSISNSAIQLKIALKALPIEQYEFIIIDCPPSLSYLTINALIASDLLIIPTQSEFFSAYALQNMFYIIDDIRKEKNRDLSYKILVTLLDLRLREHNKILNQLQKHLGNCLYKTKIQVDTGFRESQTQGIPITYSMPNTRGALQYKKLALEIVSDMPKDNRDRHLFPYTGSLLEKKVITGQHKHIHRNSSSTFLSKTQNNLPLQQAWEVNTNKPVNNNKTHEQVISITKTENQNFTQHTGIEKCCSFLGGADDPKTAISYPTTWNKCYRSEPFLSPSYNHQVSHCQTANYTSCIMLRDESHITLPSGIRSPLDASEALQYLKSWLVTKIRL